MRSLLWYPQLDVYDAVRRTASLLFAWSLRPSLPSIERVYIADFFLANPPLLHKTHMLAPTRKEFNELRIQKPEKSFLSYPSAPILFQKMEEVQKFAVQTLLGKGLIDLKPIEAGEVGLSKPGLDFFEKGLNHLLTEEEKRLINFLVDHFTKVTDIHSLRRSAGIRRIS